MALDLADAKLAKAQAGQWLGTQLQQALLGLVWLQITMANLHGLRRDDDDNRTHLGRGKSISEANWGPHLAGFLLIIDARPWYV